MMRTCCAVVFWLGLAALVSAAEPEKVDDESAVARKLIAAVPVLSSEDESLQSFELTGIMPSQAAFYPVRMELSWERDGQLSVLLSSLSDGVPIVWAAQQRVAITDPTQEQLSVIGGTLPAIQLKGTPRLLLANLGLFSDPPSQLIDLRSMFTAQDENWEVTRTEAGWEISQLSRTGKTKMTAEFSDGDEPALQTMKVVTTDESAMCLFAVESLRINKAPRSRVVELPDLGEIPHTESEIDSAADVAAALRQTSRAIIVNVGLHQPGVREQPDLSLLMGNVDWDAAQEQYERMLPGLRSLMQQHLGEVESPSPK